MEINKHNTHILLGFEYSAPTTIVEACKLLVEYSDAVVLAGGTDVIVKMKEGSLRPKRVVNIKKIPGITGIMETSDGIWIGALTRIRDIERSKLVQEKILVLYEAVRVIGSVQVRNLATIGGNVCNASPAADSAVALLALDAVAHISGPEGERKVPFSEFFKGPGSTDLARGELLTGITVPSKLVGWKGCWVRVARASMDIATISLAATVKIEDGCVKDIHLAWGAVAPTPMRTRDVEAFIVGKKLDYSVIDEAAKLAAKSIRPRESGRSSGAYKRRVAEGFVREALTRLAEK